MITEESAPRSEIATDYNKMVQLLHVEAFKDALLSKQAKAQKLHRRQERKVMRMQRQQSKMSNVSQNRGTPSRRRTRRQNTPRYAEHASSQNSSMAGED